MKIYKRAEFLGLPAGTIYAKGKPWYFSEPHIKGDTLPSNDWVCLSFNWISAKNESEQHEYLEHMLESGASYPMNDSFGRDGCFDKEEFFLVYEKDDLLKLREYVDEALKI